MNRAIPQIDSTATKSSLYMGIELSRKRWTLGLMVRGKNPSVIPIKASDVTALIAAVRRAKERFGLPHDAVVRSCYEAGRDGFWLHRYLQSIGIENVVVDSSSIEVNRRAKRAKTDRLDVLSLVGMLIRYCDGDKKPWSVVRVPTVEEEDQRRLHREMERLKKEQTAHRNRIRGLLFLHGLDIQGEKDLAGMIHRSRLWDQSPLPERLKEELLREHVRLELVKTQIRQIERLRRERLKAVASTADAQVSKLMRLVGVGVETAWTDVYELFAWRQFHNRREIAAAVGLAPMPYQSGDSSIERGISRAGNRRVRRLAIQIAWGWLRFQPKSAISIWFQQRFGHASGRMRRIGIVAVARRLLIALWRFVENDEVPQGARLHSTAAL
jgi:transposase